VPVNSNLNLLIRAIVSYITEHGGYVTKTKLLKLLYLFDVEYYRLHRQIFSGFEWKFFHLGPWTREFDSLLESLVAQTALVESASTRPEYDTKFYRTPESFDIQGIFQSFRDEATLKMILDTWGESSTGELLDYVYFRTEPMEYGVRNEPLDFSKIPEQAPPIYKRRPSGKTKQELEAARRRFRVERAAQAQAPGTRLSVTPPNYDEEFFKALSKLDAAGH
jgi:hypothetical protein